MKLNMKIFVLVILILNLGGSLQVESTQPHNSNCYTQGFSFINSTHIFESCGMYGKSYFSVMQYEPEPFTIKNIYTSPIPWNSQIFLQGSVVFKNHIYMLTWLERKVYKLNSSTLQVISELSWSPDGWGLTANDTHMFASDGSNKIYIVDENFKKVGIRSVVHMNGQPQNNINQLQYVNGSIYANIYMSNKIVKINMETGLITQQYDAQNLLKTQQNLKRDQVLNGIAYDKKTDKFLITGKHWSKIYMTKLQNQTPLSESIQSYASLAIVTVIAIIYM